MVQRLCRTPWRMKNVMDAYSRTSARFPTVFVSLFFIIIILLFLYFPLERIILHLKTHGRVNTSC